MTPAQRSMCSVLMQHMGRFYENPENERRFREWKERRNNPATDLPPTRRKAAHRKSYRIADVLLVIVTAFCVASVLWGYGCAYQVGYAAAEHFFTEVRHG